MGDSRKRGGCTSSYDYMVTEVGTTQSELERINTLVTEVGGKSCFISAIHALEQDHRAQTSR